MGKNIAAHILRLDRHFAYFIYKQGLPQFKKYGSGDIILWFLID